MEALVDLLAGRRGILSVVVGAVSGDDTFRWVGARGQATPQRSPHDTPDPLLNGERIEATEG
jgi:hypothetical protein